MFSLLKQSRFLIFLTSNFAIAIFPVLNVYLSRLLPSLSLSTLLYAYSLHPLVFTHSLHILSPLPVFLPSIAQAFGKRGNRAPLTCASGLVVEYSVAIKSK